MQKKYLLVSVVSDKASELEIDSVVLEARSLIEVVGGEIVGERIQKSGSPDPNTYVGKGKLAEMMVLVKDLEVDVVVINGILKPSQVFRIEKTLWEANYKVIVQDKVDLILTVFEMHAQTKEANLQIELARAKHGGVRIYGLGGVVLSKQGGARGTRGGSGEGNIEYEKRLKKLRVKHINEELKKLTNQKQSRMKHRQDAGLGPVALVGYTSAGKSTLFNKLTGKDMATNANLFTTLDTVVGKMKMAESRMPVLVSDTIGFMQGLPPSLIEAFKSTLMEALEAKLLLHLIDVTDPAMQIKMEVVESILSEIGSKQPMIYVLNKIDLIDKNDSDAIDAIKAKFVGAKVVTISAKTGVGIAELKQMIVDLL